MDHCEEYCNSQKNGLHKLCERFKNQPIEVLTGDRVRYCGTVLTVCADGVEIIDKCNRVIFIVFRHIDAIVQPMMELLPLCGKINCKCNPKDCECGHELQKPVPLREGCGSDKYDDYP